MLLFGRGFVEESGVERLKKERVLDLSEDLQVVELGEEEMVSVCALLKGELSLSEVVLGWLFGLLNHQFSSMSVNVYTTKNQTPA